MHEYIKNGLCLRANTKLIYFLFMCCDGVVKQRALLLLYSVYVLNQFSFLLCVGVCPGYGGFDSYNGFNNYCFGNGMFDERVRGERGGRGKVQNCVPLQQ